MGLLDDIFGTGEDPRWDDSNYTAPVYGTDSNGNEVTASFGKGDREGETLICDGYVDEETFNHKTGRYHDGHDHFKGDGTPAGKYGDRGCYTGDNDDSESQSSGLLGLF